MKPTHFFKYLSLAVLYFVLCLISVGGFLHLLLYDGLLSLLLEDTTVYSSGYSEKVFRSIHVDMHEHEVFTMLGRPLFEGWSYYSHKNKWLYTIYFDAEELVSYHPAPRTSVQRGMTKDQVLALLGAPAEKAWGYSESPTSGDYRLRVLRLKGGLVTKIVHEAYLD